MTSADIIVVVAHHTDDWTLINGLRLTHHRVDLWTKMIGHIRLLEDCLVCISQHQGFHLLHLWQELDSIDIHFRLRVNTLTYFLRCLSVIYLLDTWSSSVEAIPHSMEAIQTHIVNAGAMAIRWKKIENGEPLLWSNDFASVGYLVRLLWLRYL